MDPCVYIQDDTIIYTYIDDCVILSKDKQKITDTINILKQKNAITDERNIEEYIEIKLEHSGSHIMIPQPLLIEKSNILFTRDEARKLC